MLIRDIFQLDRPKSITEISIHKHYHIALKTVCQGYTGCYLRNSTRQVYRLYLKCYKRWSDLMKHPFMDSIVPQDESYPTTTSTCTTTTNTISTTTTTTTAATQRSTLPRPIMCTQRLEQTPPPQKLSSPTNDENIKVGKYILYETFLKP